MKKVVLMMMCLCMLCSAAFAEDVIELNWESIGTEEVAAQGEFQALEITDIGAAVMFWIPSVLKATDPSVIEGPFQPNALYVTEDDSYGVAVFLTEIGNLDEYLAMLQEQGGAANLRNVMVNGTSSFSYEIEEDDMECLLYPVTDTIMVTLTCTPLNGDEDWDLTKGAIFASLQLAR